MTGLELFLNSDVKGFIQSNLQSDIQKLLLNPPTQFRASIKAIVDQIQARQKAKGKLDSWVSNFDLILPPPLSIEQASSESTASYKKSIIGGEHLIDLSGGMGVDCMALSENFQETTYVEMQGEVAEAFRHNCQVFGKKIEIRNTHAQDFIDSLEKSGEETVFYIDPARRDDALNKVFRLEDCSPNILELLPQLKEQANRALIKLSPLVDIKSLLARLPNVREIHVVSVKNDCKEVLVLIDFSFEGEPQIMAVNIGSRNEEFVFTFPEEKIATSNFSDVGKYLLEPNSSVLKAGAFKKVASDFGVNKLNANTHLYTSDEIPSNWPGRVFEVMENGIDKKQLKTYAPKGFINVITRNYPLSSKELKKRYKLQDGGELFLIGFKDLAEKAKAVVARRVEILPSSG